MWLDECYYANPTRIEKFTDYFSAVRGEAALMWPILQWVFFGGSSDPWSFRLISAISGIGAIILVLVLPVLGISRLVSFVSALWMAVSPVLVDYSQEAREYSFGVFFATALIFGFIGLWLKPDWRFFKWWACVFLLLAPHTSYGNVLLCAALLGVHFVCLCTCSLGRLKSAILPATAFVFGVVSTYFLSAKFQLEMKSEEGLWVYKSMWFVVGNYPPDGILPALNWLKVSLKDYLAWAWGGGRTTEILCLAVGIYFFAMPKRELLSSVQGRLLMVLGCLIFGSLVLAFLGKYPFGGLRYHLFAIPLLILIASEALVFLKRKLGLGIFAFALLFGVVVVYGALVDLPAVYKEKQDIRRAINSLPQETCDRQVFIYENAIRVVDFHYPERKFHRFKTMDIPGAFAELEGLESQTIYFIFSDSISPDGIEQIDKECKRLELLGFCVAEDEEFRGVKRIRIEKPQQGADCYKTGDLPAKLGLQFAGRLDCR